MRRAPRAYRDEQHRADIEEINADTTMSEEEKAYKRKRANKKLVTATCRRNAWRGEPKDACGAKPKGKRNKPARRCRRDRQGMGGSAPRQWRRCRNELTIMTDSRKTSNPADEEFGSAKQPWRSASNAVGFTPTKRMTRTSAGCAGPPLPPRANTPRSHGARARTT